MISFFHATKPLSLFIIPLLLIVAPAWAALQIEFGQVFGVGKRASTIASADMNGDGAIDLAIANIFSNSITLALNDGDGNFNNMVQVTLQQGLQHPVAVALGDLDNDGRTDIITAQLQNFGLAGQLDPFNTSSLVLLFADADGTYRQTSYPVRGVPSSVRVADVNSDGLLDVVMGNNGEFSFDIVGAGAIIQIDSGIDVLINMGSRVFASPQPIDANGSVVDEIALDFNQDGMTDIVGINQGIPSLDPIRLNLVVTDANITLFRNTPSGIVPLSYLPVPYLPWGVDLADFNGDDLLDLAVTLVGSSDPTNYLSFLGRNASVDLYTNTGNGFTPMLRIPVDGIAYAVAARDFDLDGDVDLVVTAEEIVPGVGGNTLVPKMRLLENDGGNNFTEIAALSVEEEPRFMTVSDFDGDGDLDIAILCTLIDSSDEASAESGRVYVFFNNVQTSVSHWELW